MKRQNKSPEARGVERQLATARRDINSMLRSLKALEEGGGLTPQRKVPAKFQRVPFEGGAEGLLKDIEGTTAKQLGKVFGPAIGAKQLMAQMFKQFESAVPTHLIDYAGFAAAVGMTIIYNLSISEAGFSAADLKAAKSAFTTEFLASNLLTDAIEKALAVNTAASVAAGTAVAIKDTLSTASGGSSAYPTAVYPFNTPYIKYMSSLVTAELVGESEKCQFIGKNYKSMYAYLSKDPLPEAVPTPNMIASAIGTATIASTIGTNLKTWFTTHPEYEIDETFNYVTRAVNAIGAGSQIHDIEELNAIRSGVSKNFARLIDAIELAGLGTKQNISELNTLKDRLLECLKAKPSIDDIKDIRVLIAQAQDSTPITSVEAIGAYIITSEEIAELFATALAATTTPGPKRTGFAGELEAEEAAAYIDNISHLLDQYMALVVTPAEADAVQAWFESSLFTAAGAKGRKLRTPEVSAKFTALANATFKEALKDIKAYLDAPIKVDARAQSLTVDALNGLLTGYTSANVFSAKSTQEIDTTTTVTLLAPVIEDLLNGNRLEIYDQANDDLFDSATESLQALDDIAELNLKRAEEDLINAVVLHIASLLQTRLEALLPMALQDPSIRLRGNPAMSTLHKVGLGVGAYVGTNVVTSVAQRLVNKDGATSGGKYYAAEFAPAALVGGVGAYFIAKEKNHDVGIPLLAGAAGSVVMRMAARKVDQNGAIYKYFLKYAGGAWVGSKLGDKTFGAAADLTAITTAAAAPADSTAPASQGGAGITPRISTLNKALLGLTRADIQPILAKSDEVVTLVEGTGPVPTLNFTLKAAEPTDPAALADLKGKLDAILAALNTIRAAKNPVLTPVALPEGVGGMPRSRHLPRNYYEETSLMGASKSRSQAARSRSARGSMGRYVTSPVNPPVYQYDQPVRIPNSVMEEYVEPTETGRIYAGAAGLDKMRRNAAGAYFPTSPSVKASMRRMPVDHEDEVDSAPSQGMGRYFAPGVDMSRVNVDDDPEIADMIEHLDAADPLTSEELRREGLSGYVTSTVVRATPASAMKLEEAGVAEILKQSDSEPNTALIRVNDLGQPVSKEYNPSVAVNTGFGPQQINYAGDVADNPSGLFTRGVFSAGFPKIR